MLGSSDARVIGSKVFDRIVRKLRIQAHVYRVRAACAHYERVAIGCRFRDHFNADDATRAAAVVGNDLARELLAQFLRNDTRDYVGRTARRKRHDYADWFGWKVLRKRNRGKSRSAAHVKARDGGTVLMRLT